MTTTTTDRNRVAATWEAPADPPASIPDAADVVIIGGGIVGVSTAWFLARRGVSVALCEKGHIAGEQSGRNWGWVRQQGRDPRELPMMMEARRIWQGLERDLGESIGYRECGCLFLARNEKELGDLESWLTIARDHELDTRIIRGPELDTQITDGSKIWAGALYTASDGRAEPHLAAPAIARAAARQGAVILTHCAVRGVETAGGAVSAVVTEHGPIRASRVLCAAGAWSGMFCRSLGIRVPQLKVRGTVARTAPGPRVLDGCAYDARVGIRRREDGGYNVAHGAVLDHSITPTTLRYARKFLPALWQELHVLRLSVGRDFLDELRTPTRWPLDRPSPFEATRVLDPAPNPRVLAELKQNLADTFPALADVPVVEAWAGMVETSPDIVPIIGEADTLPGLYLATGLSGHGFGLGPGAGRTIAAMLTGDDACPDLSAFRPGRFFDGTPMRPMRSI